MAVVCLILAAGCAANPPRDDAGTARDGDSPRGDGGMGGGDGSMMMGDGGMARPDGAVCMGTDECAEGESRCSGSDIETCIYDPGSMCLVWSDAAACPGSQVCSGDVCMDGCTDACTDGARRCGTDEEFQVCAMQASGCLDWSPAEACPMDHVCTGDGVCMPCTDGTRRCDAGGGVEECFSGRWTSVESCPFGCMTGTCSSTVACTPGAYRCQADNVETCNSSGSAWLHVRTCAVACAAGLCTGACTPGETRCNGTRVETCNTMGTAWDAGTACATFCSRGVCALDGLEIATDRTLEGEVLVRGAVVIRSGATVTSSTGDLTIRADSITIENGASISVAPTGMSPDGVGGVGAYVGYPIYNYGGGGGGGYGGAGTGGYYASNGRAWGSNNDADVHPGSPGGAGYSSSGGAGGAGGGVLRLIAGTINIAGLLTANGAAGGSATYSGGGGSGGGILVAGDRVTMTGNISTSGAPGGTGSRTGGTGGNGRVKILYGTMVADTAMITGAAVTRGLLPPLELSSSTHPDPNLVYNDGFPIVAMGWNRPWSPITGYYWLFHTSERVPTPSNAQFVPTELTSHPVEMLAAGNNYFQVVPADATAMIGTVEGSFRVQLNRTPPTLSSMSHPTPSSWSTNPNVFVSWTFPHANENYRGVYYVFDHYGDTIPDTSSTFLPVSQQQVLLSAVADGIWSFHVVSADTQGYLTRTARHYTVRIGADPGAGTVFGQISDATTSMPLSGVTVEINRGLFPSQSSNGTGNFNFANITEGRWELRISKDGYVTQTRMIDVTATMSTAANVNLMPMP
ncbi:MAG: carboxypeptidase regulatory-like domain-containing protein [Sandaracinaceae bacterium]